jgi:hypothetical protein
MVSPFLPRKEVYAVSRMDASVFTTKGGDWRWRGPGRARTGMAMREGVAAQRGVCSRVEESEEVVAYPEVVVDCVRRLAQRESCGRVMDVLRAAPTRAGGDSAGALMVAMCVDVS